MSTLAAVATPSIILSSFVNGGDDRRMFVQTVYEAKDGVKGEPIGHLFMGYKSRKWTAVIYTGGSKNKVRPLLNKKQDAIDAFEKHLKKSK